MPRHSHLWQGRLDFDAIFLQLAQLQVAGLIVAPDALFTDHRDQIVVATKPIRTGSDAFAKTMGIVEVADFAANAETGLPPAAMTPIRVVAAVALPRVLS